ncbi:hypothetical protein LUZ61_004879 [Rhynchospora tenuis]|uniref:GDSL esterase/lipase n=1 Tax=Rhynchospora tenuis TaxID=198213 RepID=A0AAD5ZNX5_9POAL|nr:hypothetical protein LUZ61_004879 [Rhynchospora tenuis]
MGSVTRAALDQKLALAKRCSHEGVMAGAKAAVLATVATAIPTAMLKNRVLKEGKGMERSGEEEEEEADTGNFATLVNGAAQCKLPYGMTYFNKPTGRASDGLLVIDFIAQDLGLPLIPPSLSEGQNFRRGANFALGWFEQLKPLLCNTTESCQDYFSKSLFVLGEFGGNDYSSILSAGKSRSEAKSYIPVVINTIRQAAESLLKQGALHIVIPGIIPSGCVPMRLTVKASKNKSYYDNLGCLKEYNTIAFDHNMMLKETVVQLQSTYPWVKFIYADYFEPVIQFLQYPKTFGFTVKEPLRICCGGGGPYKLQLKCYL